MLLRLLACKWDEAAKHKVEAFVATALHVVYVGVLLHHKERLLIAVLVGANGAQRQRLSCKALQGVAFRKPAVALFTLRGLGAECLNLLGNVLPHRGARGQQVLHKPAGLPWPDA